jgi:hypothetical protein
LWRSRTPLLRLDRQLMVETGMMMVMDLLIGMNVMTVAGMRMTFGRRRVMTPTAIRL